MGGPREPEDDEVGAWVETLLRRVQWSAGHDTPPEVVQDSRYELVRGMDLGLMQWPEAYEKKVEHGDQDQREGGRVRSVQGLRPEDQADAERANRDY